jgi:hypothetical protein
MDHTNINHRNHNGINGETYIYTDGLRWMQNIIKREEDKQKEDKKRRTKQTKERKKQEREQGIDPNFDPFDFNQ